MSHHAAHLFQIFSRRQEPARADQPANLEHEGIKRRKINQPQRAKENPPRDQITGRAGRPPAREPPEKRWRQRCHARRYYNGRKTEGYFTNSRTRTCDSHYFCLPASCPKSTAQSPS